MLKFELLFVLQRVLTDLEGYGRREVFKLSPGFMPTVSPKLTMLSSNNIHLSYKYNNFRRAQCTSLSRCQATNIFYYHDAYSNLLNQFTCEL